jgi:hypothetical protein
MPIEMVFLLHFLFTLAFVLFYHLMGRKIIDDFYSLNMNEESEKERGTSTRRHDNIMGIFGIFPMKTNIASV